ncbi:hypothetical protein BGZ94_007688 [Podila epigama]|nr:hypothetical protein BGZ94_007688 [Podila epigama]
MTTLSRIRAAPLLAQDSHFQQNPHIGLGLSTRPDDRSAPQQYNPLPPPPPLPFPLPQSHPHPHQQSQPPSPPQQPRYHHYHHHQQQLEQQEQPEQQGQLKQGQVKEKGDDHQQQQQQQHPSTRALAVTCRATKGSPPPPLIGSAIVLVNDSALHCFGGRLENKELTNCHYVLDVETGVWETIEPAAGHIPNPHQNTTDHISSKLCSLSLTTDPVSNSGSLSKVLSLPPLSRYFHTLNAYGTSLILFGGMAQLPVLDQDSDNEGSPETKLRMEALDDLHVYDIITQRWQQKRPALNEHTPRARWAHLATILDHYLIVIGGTDTFKAYVEDACVLDLHTWEWVASIQNIGQCGSYRTIAATGPSVESSCTLSPSSPSFPSAEAFAPQISSNLSWPSTESGPIDAMTSISMVLSGCISEPSSTSSSDATHSPKDSKDTKDTKDAKSNNKNSQRQRLMSGELTPAFKVGTESPSIYLYSNFNFHNLQRDLKIITPSYSHSGDNDSNIPVVPSFSMVDKTQTLLQMGHGLPPGLRFPQGHVYQNQLILTGTLIVPGKTPTLAVYALNLVNHSWERLPTDTILETGSWNRTLLHPATGTLLIFGHREGNADADYANRIQHHEHLTMVNLQAYGLYERPIPSFIPAAQDLGSDLLGLPSLNDMHIASSSGTLFEANSTILASRWPEFGTLLLSPPYITPLILTLPVPDDVVPLFLHYLYTGALPHATNIRPGMADYLLILARRYELNGLHALVLDHLHQSVTQNPVRVYSSALMAGELGLQARAVDLAIATLPSKTQESTPPQSMVDVPLPPPPHPERRRPPIPALAVDSTRLGRNHSNRVPPPSARPTLPPARHHSRTASHHSRDSVSTEGTAVGDSLVMQYTNLKSDEGFEQRQPSTSEHERTFYLSSPEPTVALPSRQRKLRTPPIPPSQQYQQPQPLSTHSTHQMASSKANANHVNTVSTPRVPQAGNPYYQQYQQQQEYQQQQHRQQERRGQSQTQRQYGYPSPLPSDLQQQALSSSQSMQGSLSRAGSDGTPSIYSHDDHDDGSSIYSGYQSIKSQHSSDARAQQAKRRLQQQLQHDMEQQQRQQEIQQQQEQRLLMEQQRLREQEIQMIEQHRLQQQQFLLKQQKLRAQQMELEAQAAAAAITINTRMGALDYHFGGGDSQSSIKSPSSVSSQHRNYAPSQMTVESTAGTVISQKSGSSKASIKSGKSDKEKKGILSKMKPPKPKASGAELMKSAGF